MRIKAIARWAHVINASAAKGSDAKKYSICGLIHKSDPQCAQITAQFEAAKQNAFPTGFPANGHIAWTDCATTEPATPELHDYMMLKVSTNEEMGRPVLVDLSVQPIIDPGWDGTCSGRFVYLDVSEPQGYDKGSKGVKCYLNGVMDTGEMGPIPADKLSSKPTAESMFGDIAGGGMAAPAMQQPAAPAMQAAVQQPAPPSPMSPPAPAAQPQYIMTDKAQGMTREQLLANGQGWTDELLISNGLMLPPGGVQPSFA